MSTTCGDCGTTTHTDNSGMTWWARDTADGFGSDGHAHNGDGPQDLSAPFTLAELEFYHAVIDGAHRSASCRWLTDLGEPFGGTLRTIVDARSGSDVRTMSVRITTSTGGERVIPLYQLRNQLHHFTIRST